MKKVLFMVLFSSFSMFSQAQRTVGNLSMQPKVGLNLATMTNDDDAKIRPAIVGGLEFEYQASQKIAFSFGALYSQQGCKSEEDGVKGTIKLDYINVPLLANIYVADGFALKFGIQPGFLINDKVKVSANGVSAEIGLEESFRAAGLNADLKSIDLSIPVGFSYEYNNILFDARYNLGLTKIMSGSGIDPTKNSVFQFTLGYKFGL